MANKHINNNADNQLSAVSGGSPLGANDPITTGQSTAYAWTFTTVFQNVSASRLQNVGSGDYLTADAVGNGSNVSTAALSSGSHQDWVWDTGATYNPLHLIANNQLTTQTPESFKPNLGSDVTTYQDNNNPWTTWQKTATGDLDGSYYIDRHPLASPESTGNSNADALRMYDNGSGDVRVGDSASTSDFAKWVETTNQVQLVEYTTIQSSDGLYLADNTNNNDDPVLLDGSGGVTANMKWTIHDLGGGYFQIQNQATSDGIEMWQTGVGTFNLSGSDQLQWTITAAATAIPEPSVALLAGLGLCCLGTQVGGRVRPE